MQALSPAEQVMLALVGLALQRTGESDPVHTLKALLHLVSQDPAVPAAPGAPAGDGTGAAPAPAPLPPAPAEAAAPPAQALAEEPTPATAAACGGNAPEDLQVSVFYRGGPGAPLVLASAWGSHPPRFPQIDRGPSPG